MEVVRMELNEELELEKRFRETVGDGTDRTLNLEC